jgi:hypothetical protein
VRAALAAILAALAFPATAAAVKGDLPSYPVKPADGATVHDASKGLPVVFTCPRYHVDERADVLALPTEGYHVLLSTNNQTTFDGLLGEPGRVDERGVVRTGEKDKDNECAAEEDDAGLGLLPREPGTYYWQVYRECVTYLCGPGGREVFDISRVVVTRTVCTVTRAELRRARSALAAARRALRERRTAARRTRVSRLADRVATLRGRLRVVYGCRA